MHCDMNMNREKKIAVLGLGNILLTDEGVGAHAIGALRNGFVFPGNVKLIDGGTMGLDLLPFIEGLDNLLIVDAVNIKKKSGTIVIIEDNDIPSFLSTKLSVHQIGFPDVLSAAKLMGVVPEKMSLIGIQPDRIETGIGLSHVIHKRFGTLLKTAVEKLQEWGVELVPARLSKVQSASYLPKTY